MASLLLTAFVVVIGIVALVKLGDRIARLESQVKKLQSDAIAQRAARPPPAAVREAALPSPVAEPSVSAPNPSRAAAVAAPPRVAPITPPAPDVARGDPPAPPRPPREVPSYPEPEPTPLVSLFEWVQRWLTTGNVPAKVGVLLSIVGVGFLVKEGIDRHWLVLPLSARLALVALFGVAMLAVGWRLKARERGYGLSLQ